VAATFKLDSFIGKATVAIDAAGRTNFPKDFRKALKEEAGGQVIVTIGGASTLALYPVYEWNAYLKSIEEKAKADKVNWSEFSKFRTRLTAMAKLSVLDGQNRISLTTEQMSYAGISGEVTFVGDGNRVRLWAPASYAEQVEQVTPEQKKTFENWF
jgi:MraZ protein